jgi:type VI secretion system protein ImpB
MSDSTQHKLDRVRPPRVHITYDVEIGDAVEQKEIPFVVGVLSDLSGKPEKPLPQLKERKCIEIDRDNFNSILEGMKPRLAFKVDNRIEDDDTKIAVELQFNSLDDFHPERVAQQIEPVRRLVEARRKLYNLLGKLDGNDKLEALLQDVITNTEKLEMLNKQSSPSSDAADAPDDSQKETE